VPTWSPATKPQIPVFTRFQHDTRPQCPNLGPTMLTPASRPTAPSLQDFHCDMSLETTQHNCLREKPRERHCLQSEIGDGLQITIETFIILAPPLDSHRYAYGLMILEYNSDPHRERLDGDSRYLAPKAAESISPRRKTEEASQSSE
jgi:hypothetical protein